MKKKIKRDILASMAFLLPLRSAKMRLLAANAGAKGPLRPPELSKSLLQQTLTAQSFCPFACEQSGVRRIKLYGKSEDIMAESDRIRTKKFSVYLLPEEDAMLQKNSEEYGLSKSDYVRKLILYGGITGRQWMMDKEEGKKLLYEINKIGNNLNQIAYRTNVQMAATYSDLMQVIENYREFLRLVGKLPFLDESAQGEWAYFANEFIEKEFDDDKDEKR